MALTKRRRRWLWLGIIALGLFGWWWCTRPKPLRLVARRSLGTMVSLRCIGIRPGGVSWVDDDQGLAKCLRWDGAPASWQIDLRKIHLPGDTWWIDASGFNDAVFSSDMRTVALTHQESATRVNLLMWQDGRLLTSVPLPGVPESRPVIDRHGAIWCAAGGQLLRVQGTRITARGRIPIPGKLVISPDASAVMVCNNGNVNFLLSFFTYYAVQASGSTVQCRPVHTGGFMGRGFEPYFVTRDMLMLPDFFNDGLCGHQGLLTVPKGWHYRDEHRWPGNAPVPETTAVVQQQERWVDPNTYYPVCGVFVPATQQSWLLPENVSDIQALTPDGRFALVIRHPAALVQWPALSRFPGLERQVNWQLGRARTWQQLAIYERPGRLRATLSPWAHPDPTREVYPVLSPDGHTVHLVTTTRQDYRYTLTLEEYRW
ncbi:MAG: hypothetical protein ACYDBB_27305 [Armatimonadota bacterium]